MEELSSDMMGGAGFSDQIRAAVAADIKDNKERRAAGCAANREEAERQARAAAARPLGRAGLGSTDRLAIFGHD